MSEKNEIFQLSKLSADNKTQKYVDIFLHLRTNMQNNAINCKCKTNDKYYCIPCKVTCCSTCSFKTHQPHILIRIKDNHLDANKINKVFNDFTKTIKRSKLISKSKELMEELDNQVDRTIDEIISKLNLFRNYKKRKITALFEKLEKNKASMNKNVEGIKKDIIDYIVKNKKFYNFDSKNGDANNDINNTFFLIGYDILNLINQSTNEIFIKIDAMEEDLQHYIDNQMDQFHKLISDIDKSLEIEKISSEDNSNNEEDINLNSPYEHFLHITDELGVQYFSPINSRLNKYTKTIENFQKAIFKTIKNKGSLKEIEMNIKSFENMKLQGAESLFSQRDINKNKISKNFNFNQSNMTIKKNVNSETDICLNNPVINRYFSYLLIDLYDKHFKVLSKELQSSHADLIIKVNEDEENNDVGKVIEGTNEIQIYEKKANKMYKVAVKLTKNPYGYTKFPIGCRCLLIGDKVYISGGRDELTQYPNVLVFDRKTKNIKRIMDLRVPRAYHTMIYSNVFCSLMVFGGENEKSVEIFDPFTNRWQLLPELNIPRANTIFYSDNPRGILYNMFGTEGNILDNKYSDVIEFLDLKNIKEGWIVLDYRNRSETDLKNLMNIYPLNNDLLLLYGGVVFRGTGRSICVFNLTKSEITEITPSLMEQLRCEAKKNKKLSTIISGITSKCVSGFASPVPSKVNL